MQESWPGSVIQVETTKALCSFETRLSLFAFPTSQASVRNIIFAMRIASQEGESCNLNVSDLLDLLLVFIDFVSFSLKGVM